MKRWLSSSKSDDAGAKRLDTAVDQRLRASTTSPEEAPPWLHASIMKAVRQNTGVESTSGLRFRFAWALPVLLVVLLAGWFLLQPPTPGGSELANEGGPTAPLTEAAWQSAALVVQPLDEELANLTRDLERTQQFLLASLP